MSELRTDYTPYGCPFHGTALHDVLQVEQEGGIPLPRTRNEEVYSCVYQVKQPRGRAGLFFCGIL